MTLSRLSRTWESYGRRDPFFGVLSDPAKRGGKWDAGAFFASGDAHVQNLWRSLADARIERPRGAALDFGCGVGRLTQALCGYFDTITGVDVAASMIRRARAFNRWGARCRYVVNRREDLSRFPDATFAFVHSCLVLQHMPPALATRYIAEFFRVCRPGGLVVFQMPSEARTADESPGAFALRDADYRAEIALHTHPDFHAGTHATIFALITNRGQSVWPETTPSGHAGRIMLANHWLDANGDVIARDDGRGALPRAVWPGDTVQVPMVVTPPAQPGRYVLELDLVQELVTWFGDKGSPTVRVAVDVVGARREASPPQTFVTYQPAPPALSIASRVLLSLERLVEPLRPAAAPFEMHTLARADVEAAIARAGGTLVRAIEDDACGPRWRSWTYICLREEVGPAKGTIGFPCAPRAGGELL
jgi:SAM-dependent methyltransferase